MATTGTVGQTIFQQDDIVQRAARRAGILASRLTPEHLMILRGSLQLMLTEFSTMGIKLWAINRTLLPVYPGQLEVPLPTGSIDVLNALYRNPSHLTPASVTSSAGGTTSNLYDLDTDTLFTQTAINGSVVFDLGSVINLNMIGLLPSGSWSSNLLLEHASASTGPWTTVKAFGALSMVDGVWQWFQLDPATTKQYVRLSETGGGTMAFREVYLCNLYQDTTIARVNRDDHSSMPFKQTSSQQPTQYWLNRQIASAMVLWPGVSNTFAAIYAFIHRHIQDVGTDLTLEIEVPQRWLPTVIWNLTKEVMMEMPDLIDPGVYTARWPIVESKASSSLAIATAEERDTGPISFAPNISPYTR